MEQFQKTIVKQIISLANNVANPAVHILSGIPHQALIYLGSIARKDTSAEYSVAKRQLIMKSADSPSWFNYVRSVCIKYDLPSQREVLDHQQSKNKWKQKVKAALSKYWEGRLI